MFYEFHVSFGVVIAELNQGEFLQELELCPNQVLKWDFSLQITLKMLK